MCPKIERVSAIPWLKGMIHGGQDATSVQHSLVAGVGSNTGSLILKNYFKHILNKAQFGEKNLLVINNYISCAQCNLRHEDVN